MQQITAQPEAQQPIPPPQEPKSRRFRTFRVISALILREIGTTDSRSSLGFLWSFIDPLATIVILTILFSVLSRTPPLGNNYPLYYVTGVIPFNMFARIAGRVSGSIRFSKNLLGFPSVKVLDALFARFLLNMFIDIFMFIVVTYGIVHYYGLRVNLDVPAAVISIVMAGSLAIGVGTFNSVLIIMFPIYESAWGMVSRPLLIASGVLIMLNDLPTKVFNVLWWNPAAHVVAQMRHAFFPYYDAHWVSLSYTFLFAAVTFTLGLVTLQRYVYDALEI